ncbi:MAG: two-CW domain-containing protein [Thermodesulfobacteriota bacterium]
MALNCWEATKCGRERFCPAYPRNGRLCYAVTGTLCRGEKQGSYIEKIGRCRETCSFYAAVMRDRGVDLDLAAHTA